MESLPSLLTVGAYERDNFGDLLFLLVTERYLPGARMQAGAPFAADMSELLDRRVVAFGQEMTARQFDVVWTVGGGVGCIGLPGAYRLSHSAELWAAYKDASEADRREILARATHRAPITFPYIPTPGAFPINASAFTILNSAGMGGAKTLPANVAEELVEVLRLTDCVSVRDRQSSEWLSQNGIEHTLAPDAVHALGALDPFERDPLAEHAVVQVSRSMLDKIGRERLARRLVDNPHLAGLKLELLLAGTATGHDCFEDMYQVAAHIEQLDPGREVEVVTARRPMDLVCRIRSARVVICSSLHVRIVASTYAVPRVTLVRPKPTRYAEHWDPGMPYDVRIKDLDDAVGHALANADSGEMRAESERLTALAHTNLRGLADVAMASAGAATDPARAELGERRRAAFAGASARRS